MSAEERWNEWGEHYQDLEPAEIQALIVATGEWLERLVRDREAVDAAMRALWIKLYPASEEPNDNDNWRSFWEDFSESLELPMSEVFTNLNAYAYFGLLPVDKKTPREQRQTSIGELLSEIREFMSSVPPGWATLDDAEHTLLAAEARYRLDTGQDVAPDQLAALVRMQLRSFKNLLMPGSGSGLRPNETDGLIPNAVARRWIEVRDDFKPSIWREQEGSDPIAREPADQIDDEVLFVPVDGQGNPFHPVICRRAGAYTIGAKGEEERVTDYRAALGRLARMPKARWRRPNAVGNWGIVSAPNNRWQRVTARELGLL